MPNSPKCLAALLLAIVICAGGCAKKTEPVHVEYYPACHEPLAYLHERSGAGVKSAARGAIQGGVISGIASAIVQAITGNFSGAGMAVGMGVGAAIGGVAGGLNGDSAMQKADNQHLAAYLEQIDGNIEGMNIVTAAATVSRQCYTREYKQLLESMKRGEISVSAARSRFAEIEAGETEAAKLLKQPNASKEYAAQFEEAAAADRQNSALAPK